MGRNICVSSPCTQAYNIIIIRPTQELLRPIFYTTCRSMQGHFSKNSSIRSSGGSAIYEQCAQKKQSKEQTFITLWFTPTINDYSKDVSPLPK